jgi:hypothetical protein
MAYAALCHRGRAPQPRAWNTKQAADAERRNLLSRDGLVDRLPIGLEHLSRGITVLKSSIISTSSRRNVPEQLSVSGDKTVSGLTQRFLSDNRFSRYIIVHPVTRWS